MEPLRREVVWGELSTQNSAGALLVLFCAGLRNSFLCQRLQRGYFCSITATAATDLLSLLFRCVNVLYKTGVT